MCFFVQAEDGRRDPLWSRGLGGVYEGQVVPFDLRNPEVKISGKGLEADFSNQKYTIKSEVHAVHEPI